MKTSKKIFLFVFGVLCFAGTQVLNAQVTVGSDKAPESYSALEIVSTSGGLRLPQLNATQRDALTTELQALTDADKIAAAKGLTIYNTTTSCMDTWNGTLWISNCSSNAAPQITTQPRAFNWKETVGAGKLTGIGGDADNISVMATGVGTLTYQWYEVPTNVNAQAVAVSDGTGYSTAKFTPNLTKLGMRRYFCRVADANGEVDSDIAEVAVGCGAKTVQGGWLTFMCYNLGATATTIKAQKETNSPVFTAPTRDNSSVAYGDLYQWGRSADGHQKRNSAAVSGSVANYTGTANTFIIPTVSGNWSTLQYSDFGWRPAKNEYDPCPVNWRVPSRTEWGDVFKGGMSSAAPTAGIVNTWAWHDGGTKGYEIKPDGVTTTLFLPTAGHRSASNGELINVGTLGYYWTANFNYHYAHYLLLTNTVVSPANTTGSRANGFSVRCVSEY